MPGFISWITNLFSAHPPEHPEVAETRLFNPAKQTLAGEHDTPPADLIAHLEDHLFSWLLDAQPSALRANATTDEPVLRELERRLTQNDMEELPRRPGSLPKLMQALAGATTERKQITDIILSDPALTDQLLQVANSPYFRPGDYQIESVDQAVFILGIDGIRNVISAAVMRPMMAARNSREALFAQRAWRWGLTCARAAELIARLHKDDTSAHFMVGLLPSLAYITIRRELTRIARAQGDGNEPSAAVMRAALARYQWTACQLLANVWNLPPVYHAWLLAAERPALKQPHSALTDGLLLGTREVLRHARQRNLSEPDLQRILHITPEQVASLRRTLLAMLNEGKPAQAGVQS